MAFLPFRDRARIVLFRWPAIVAGLFVALGIHIVLTAFGLGVVFLQSEAEGSGSMAVAGLLLWSGFAWVTASFIGGWRLSGGWRGSRKSWPIGNATWKSSNAASVGSGWAVFRVWDHDRWQSYANSSTGAMAKRSGKTGPRGAFSATIC